MMLIKKMQADLAQSLNAIQSPKPGPSLISADLVVVGTMRTAGEIHVDGKIQGDVHTPRLTIGHEGRVEGDVFAEHVDVLGEVMGNVSAHTVFVASTGRVGGNILVETLTVEPGARFEGHCGRLDSRGQGVATLTTDNAPVIAQASPKVKAA